MPQYDSPWLKRVLIPFWVLRMLGMLILIGIYAFAIAAISGLSESDVDSRLNVDDSDFNAAKAAALGILGAILFVLCVCFLLDIIAIVLLARHNLRPLTFLIFNIAQTLFWAVMLILSIVGAARWNAFGGIIITIIVFLLYLGLLIYSSVVYHRERKGRKTGGYKQTSNPGNYEATSYGNENAYNPPQPHGASAEYYSVPAPQQPQTYYNPSVSPAPHQQYSAYKGASAEGAYEMPERPMH